MKILLRNTRLGRERCFGEDKHEHIVSNITDVKKAAAAIVKIIYAIHLKIDLPSTALGAEKARGSCLVSLPLRSRYSPLARLAQRFPIRA